MIYLYGIVAVIMLALTGYARLEHARAAEWEAKYMAADARRVAEQERMLQVATAAEMKREKDKRNDAAKAAALKRRSRDLSSVASVHLSSNAVRLFADASAFANGTAATPERDSPPAAAVSESALGDYAAKAAEAYRDAYGQWLACVNFYNQLRDK